MNVLKSVIYWPKRFYYCKVKRRFSFQQFFQTALLLFFYHAMKT